MSVDNRTTRKENNKYQTTNIFYDQNTISIINKIKTKSNSHQIKFTRIILTYTSIEEILDLKMLIIGILENTMIKIKQQTLFSTETRCL